MWFTVAAATGGCMVRDFVSGTSIEVSGSKVFVDVNVVCLLNFGQNPLVITIHLSSFCTSSVDDPQQSHLLDSG